MSAIENIQQINFISWIIVGFMLLSAFIAGYEIICKFSEIIKKPIGMAKQRKAVHELLIKTVNDLKELHNKHEEDTKQSIRHDEMICEDLKKLTKIVVDKEIDDMRWEILNFSSALTSGRKYNKESFDHVIQIHEKYEKILEENGLENGQVTASMEVIMDVYKEKLRTGF